MLLVLQFFIGAFNEDYQISEEIRNGLINQFLLKPINYFAYRFSIFARRPAGLGRPRCSCRCSSPCPSSAATHLPHEPWRLALGLPAMALAAIIQFSIAYCFGLLTFWFLEIQGFVILSMAVETLLGGQMFPLDLMPRRGLPRRRSSCRSTTRCISRPRSSPAGSAIASRSQGLGDPGRSGRSSCSASRSCSGRAACAATPPSEADAAMTAPLPPHLARQRPLLARADDDVPRRLPHLVAGRALLDGGQRR